MNKKRRVILAGIIFLFSIFFINFASAVEGCNSDADCLAGEICNQNSFKCQDAALVGSWNFDDGTARDSSVNRKDGVLSGDAYITPEGTLKMSGAGYMDIPSANDAFRAPIEGAQEYTIFLKAKLAPGNPHYAGLVTWYYPFDIDLRYGNLLWYWYYGGNMGYSTPIPSDAWKSIAVTHKTGGQINLYVDGVIVASKSAPTYNFGFSNAPFHIGDDYTALGATLKGEMDDILVYSRELTPDEIKKLAGITAPTLPSGVSSVTGTVTISGGTNLGDIIIVNGGSDGGDISIVDNAKVLTTKVTVPAGKEMQFSLNNLGELTIISTNADIYKKFFIRSLKPTENNYLIRTKQWLETSLKVKYNNGFDIFEHEGRTNVNGAFANNADIKSELKLPNGWSASSYIPPGKPLAFLTERTLSGQIIMNIQAPSGLIAPVEFRERSGIDFAKVNMLYNTEVEFLVDEVKGLAFIVPSGNIELTSLASQAGMTFYSMKVRELRQGQLSVAAPANYKFDANGDGISDVEYNSKMGNYFFGKVFGSGYDQLSQTRANGINLAVFYLSTNRAPTATVTHNELSITKNIGESETFNFISQKTKDGREIYVKGNSREILGSLIEEVSPEAIIEGWNYWYTATDDNYWQWSVILESLPTGCTADKTSASTTVANGVQTLAFNVDCGTTTSTTGAVISGFATKPVGDRGFATKGRASLLSSFSDCTEVLPNGEHKCSPSQQFREEAAQVVKGVMNPTGSTIRELEDNGASITIIISLLTLIGIIVLIALQVNRKTVNW